MPAVELLLARQATGKRTTTTGSLSVSYSVDAASLGDLAAAMSINNHVLSIPFVSCMFRVDNTDSGDDLLVTCKTGTSITVSAGDAALLFCDGANIHGGPASGNGMVKLASGTISSPLSLIDLDMPSGYVQFKLEIFDLVMSTRDTPAIALSADGGVSFVNDASNFDSYRGMSEQAAWDHTNPVAGPIAQTSVDSLLTLSSSASSSELPALVTATIYPGSAGSYAQVVFEGFTNENSMIIFKGWGFVSPAAMITPTKERMNLLRFQPYGNGDCNPATSTTTITAATYVFWGIKL